MKALRSTFQTYHVADSHAGSLKISHYQPQLNRLARIRGRVDHFAPPAGGTAHRCMWSTWVEGVRCFIKIARLAEKETTLEPQATMNTNPVTTRNATRYFLVLSWLKAPITKSRESTLNRRPYRVKGLAINAMASPHAGREDRSVIHTFGCACRRKCNQVVWLKSRQVQVDLGWL